MTKVFVTGASGFIAKHILRELFDKRYEVRAGIRSERRKGELEALYPGNTLEFAYLDLDKDDGWDTAMEGCDVLMHTASPFILGTPKDPQDLIRPAVEGTKRAMRAAQAAGIKRVILTSSCSAIYKEASKPKTAPSDETNWTTPDAPFVSAYEASKTLGEKAAWDFVADHPDIALTTIVPGAVYGAPMDAHYGASLQLIEQFMTGKVPMAPPMHMPSVDVRDVAMMHVAAIDHDAAKGERFAANAGAVEMIEVAKILHDWDPSLKTPTRVAPIWLMRLLSPFMADAKAVMQSAGRNLDVSGAKAEATFGFKFRPAAGAIVAAAEAISAKKP
ncbi:MAG: NAD-dependent epimerase/dehydratase family protein [Pseudomonadota bacterium]